jgi:hypothetical protein
MEPIAFPHIHTFRSLKLYREDLTGLLSIFQRYCNDALISDGRHLYESIEEMASKFPARLPCFALYSRSMDARLVIRGSWSSEFTDWGNTITVIYAPDVAAPEGLYLAVRDFLGTRGWTTRRFSMDAAVLLGLIVMMGSSWLARSVHGNIIHTIELNIAAVLGVGLALFGIIINRKKVSYVTLQPQATADSFWKRNRDKIFLVLITVVITELIHWAATHLLK